MFLARNFNEAKIGILGQHIFLVGFYLTDFNNFACREKVRS